MYCNKCGTENPDDAIYCKKCGGLMEPEDETRVAARDVAPQSNAPMAPIAPGDEEQIFTIAPTLKFVYAGYVLAVIGAFLLVALFSLFLSPWIGVWPGVILGLALLLIPAYYHIRQKLISYTLTDTTIEINRGLISKTTQNIPLRRVQDVTVTATFFQRLLGYGDISIDNASETGGKIILDNVDAPKRNAELILKQMRHIER